MSVHSSVSPSGVGDRRGLHEELGANASWWCCPLGLGSELTKSDAPMKENQGNKGVFFSN